MTEEETPLLGKESKKTIWRHYLLEVIVFLFCVAHFVADLASYIYMYSALARSFNYTANTNSSTQHCIGNKSDPNYVLEQKVAKAAAMYQLYFGLAAGLPGVLACVIYGTYSDKIGRRFMMVISMVGIGGRAAVYVVVCHWNLSMFYLFIGYGIEGISGSFPTFVLGIMAYSADISAVGKARVLRMVLVNAVGGLATAAAYVISGYIVIWLGYDYTFATVIGTFGLAAFFTIFLPETRRGQGMDHLTFRQYLYRAVRFYTEGSKTNPNRFFYIFCMLAFMCAIIINNCLYGTETLFMLNAPLCWKSVRIGDFGAVKQTFQRVLGVSLIAVLLRFFNEISIIFVVGTLYVASLSMEAFAMNNMFMYIAGGLGIGSLSFSTVIRSILSGHTDKDHQGALFASTQLCSSLFTATGTILFSAIYEWTVELMPGGVFLVMAGIILLSVVFMGVVHYLLTRPQDISMKTI